MNRSWLWALAGLIVGALLGFFAFQGGLGKASSAERPPAAEVRRPPAETPEERERRAVAIAVRGVDGELVEAVHPGGGWRLGVEMRRRPPQLDELERDAMRAFREIHRTGAPVERVVVVLRTDHLKDVYGNPLKDVVVARVALSGDTFRRINWDGFDPKNFPRVADEFWLHDELQQQLVQREQQQTSPGQAGGQAGGQQGGGGGGGSGGSTG
ncbi:MAG TPA: hypothetical protein VIK93_08285 [Limnochordales bacterium]